MSRLHHSIVGDGPAVILLHAFPLDSRMWAAQSAALAARHYTCVTVDFSGFGRSSTDSPVHAIDDHAYDISELLHALHLDKVHMVGLSMGGYVALSFASRYAHRLASLTLANTRAGADSPEAAANRDNGIALAEQHGSAALLDQLMPKMLSPSALPSLKAQVRSIAEAQPQQSLMAALAAMRDRSDATETLRALDVPCLLVGASEDALAPPDVMRDMKRTQPDADLVMLAGVGHLSAMQAPAEFTGALGHFFDSLRH